MKPVWKISLAIVLFTAAVAFRGVQRQAASAIHEAESVNIRLCAGKTDAGYWQVPGNGTAVQAGQRHRTPSVRPEWSSFLSVSAIAVPAACVFLQYHFFSRFIRLALPRTALVFPFHSFW